MNTHTIDMFCKVFYGLKVPDEYSSNILIFKFTASYDNTVELHDCHILMPQLLPIAYLDTVKKEIIITLCRLEMVFFPNIYLMHLDITETIDASGARNLEESGCPMYGYSCAI